MIAACELSSSSLDIGVVAKVNHPTPPHAPEFQQASIHGAPRRENGVGRNSLLGVVGVAMCAVLQVMLLALVYESLREDIKQDLPPSDWHLALTRVSAQLGSQWTRNRYSDCFRHVMALCCPCRIWAIALVKQR